MTFTDQHEPWTDLAEAGRVPPVDDAVIAAARAAVRRASATETLRTDVVRARRRRRLRMGLVAATVIAAVAIGTTTFERGGERVGVSPAAAEVLERAASQTLAQSDPVVRPGQYLRVTLVEETRGARIATGTERWTRQIWIPYDVDANWTFRERTQVVTSHEKGGESSTAAESDRTWRQPSWADNSGRGDYLPTYDPRWFAALPAEPDRLLATLRAEIGGEGSGTAYNVREIYSEALRSGLAPAAVRARLFEALARHPEITVTYGVATLDGRTGTGIGLADRSWMMVFDASTGRYIGEWAREGEVSNLPETEPSFVSAVRTDVVDSAPSPR